MVLPYENIKLHQSNQSSLINRPANEIPVSKIRIVQNIGLSSLMKYVCMFLLLGIKSRASFRKNVGTLGLNTESRALDKMGVGVGYCNQGFMHANHILYN
jgi:hypothetical protein